MRKRTLLLTLALAALLAASDRSAQFADYLNRADRVIAP